MQKSKIDIQQNKLNYIYSTFHCSMFLLGKAFFAFKKEVFLMSFIYVEVFTISSSSPFENGDVGEAHT